MTVRRARQDLRVLPADSLVVTDGAARGEALGIADDLVMDDVYQLAPPAGRSDLAVERDREGRLAVAAGSPAGTAGHAVHLDACLTLMAPDGRTLELLVLVEVEGDAIAEVWALPLGPLEPRTDYRLVGIDRHAATARLAEVACVSFVRGTRITLAGGEQRPVEELRVGDRVLTRDEGPQPVRWIGHRTLRATGAFAPVLIRKGALHNANDLLLSPDHRILVYQRRDQLGAGRAEVMVKVRHLVNGTTVVVRDGGFVEYFQLLLDDHQIIFAEGIAAESLLVDPRTRAALPEALGEHGPRPHQAYEVQESLLSRSDVVELLRRASQAG
jgi:hypothetical protein